MLHTASPLSSCGSVSYPEVSDPEVGYLEVTLSNDDKTWVSPRSHSIQVSRF